MPWQPNLGKNKPKLHRIHFCAKDRELFRTNSKVFGVGEFKYYIIIIERKDLGGVMSKDCKDTLQTLKTVTKRECDAK